MVAEPRDLLPGKFGDLEHRHPRLELDLDPVDLGLGHQTAMREAAGCGGHAAGAIPPYHRGFNPRLNHPAEVEND